LSNYDPVTADGDFISQTIEGRALRVPLTPTDVTRYRELGLVIEENPMLLFVPSVDGEEPVPEMIVNWDSEDLAVQSVQTLGPSGRTVASRVIVGK